MKIFKWITAVLAGLLALALVWGAGIEPRLIDWEEERVVIPNLPPIWEGRRVALIADLQVGMWLNNTGTVRRLVKRLVEERPAAVLIAGDFIYHPIGEKTVREAREELEPEEILEAKREITKAVDLIRPLVEAGVPTYAVLGNHDYGMETPESVKLVWLSRDLEEALERAGVEVLRNEAVRAARPPGTSGASSRPLYIVGIGSHYAGRDRAVRALAGVPDGAARIVMMHNPDSFESLPPGTAPLAVAGHTHGGQVRMPGLPSWSWMALAYDDAVHTDGWIRDYGGPGNRLYVNRGIGFSVVPVRINAPPEVTLFQLRSGGSVTARLSRVWRIRHARGSALAHGWEGCDGWSPWDG